MSSGGKGSIKFWEYYGTIAGIICNGPVDTIEEIIIDGESSWQGPLDRAAGETHVTLTLDARRVVRFYWGGDDQPVDPLLQSSGNTLGHDHPSYAGFCYIVLVDFLFGRERTSAPNVEVVVARRPWQTLISGDAAQLHEQQASPLATLAEILGDRRHGLGLEAAGLLDGISWEASAAAQFAGNAHRRAHLSPLLNQQVPLRQAVAEMALNADLWLRFNARTRLIEAGIHPHGNTVEVSSLPLLSEDDLTARPRFEGTGWGDVETGWAISFTDRQRGYKETTEKHDDLRALSIVGDHRRATLKRPWITRRDQASFHLTEYAKSHAEPTVKGQLEVRRAKALEIRPGDLIRYALPLPEGTTEGEAVPPVPSEWVVFDTADPRPFLEVDVGVTSVYENPPTFEYSSSYPIQIEWMPPIWGGYNVVDYQLNPHFIRVVPSSPNDAFRECLIATARFETIFQRQTLSLIGAVFATGALFDVDGHTRLAVRFIDDDGLEKIALSAQRIDTDPRDDAYPTVDNLQVPLEVSFDGLEWTGIDPLGLFPDTAIQFTASRVLGHATAVGFFSYYRGRYSDGTVSRMAHLLGMQIRFGDTDAGGEPGAGENAGGASHESVFRVVERTVPQTGPVRLLLEAETGLSAQAYTAPEEEPQLSQPLLLPEIDQARLLELPPPLAGDKNARMGVLAERPHDLAIGLNVHYDSEADGTFIALGIQEIFALRARPVDGWSESDTGEVSIEVLSTRDLDLLDDDPGPTAARDNQLLLFALETDPASGAIATDANGFPRMEVLSIEALELTAAATYTVTVLRARSGTRNQTISAANGELWILPAFGVMPFTHQDFAQPSSSGFFRLQPFSAFGERPLAECANRSFTFAASSSYAAQVRFTSPSTGSLSFSEPPGNLVVEGDVQDVDGNLVNVSLLRSSDSGTLSETLLFLPMAPTGQYAFSRVVPFEAYGSFTLTARAQDASGNVSEALLTIDIGSPASSGDPVAPVVISPDGAQFWGTTTVTLFCPTSGALIEYATTDMQTTEAPGTGWTSYAGAITITSSLRLWARASAVDMIASDPVSAGFLNLGA